MNNEQTQNDFVNKFLQPSDLEIGLYIVPTPIGNLQDITLRSLNVLRSVDYIACEDTRSTDKLLKFYNIPVPKLFSYHNFNETEKSQYIIELIKEGKKVALVSDAGTPLISDPGYKIVQLMIENNLYFEVLPGANAVLPALIFSGFPVHSFTFLGFPPQKKNRKKFLENLKNLDSTIILYESPFRIKKLVLELKEIFTENQKISISREISKKFEETIRGTIKEVNDLVNKKENLKGEFVVLISGERCL
jgi:16S rRNA (cytidine1402-2'-O)-methyltransferase